MKILELTNYSAGGCGVFNRVKQESIELEKIGHKVLILSSNLEKGTDKIVSSTDKVDKIEIRRFPAIKLGGESFMYWFNKDAERISRDFNPNIIIAHSYRHLHTLNALRLAKKIKCKVFLVTHAPFARNSTRSTLANFAVRIYDSLFRSKILKFDKVISITHWELPYLYSLGLHNQDIEYVPNGIRKEFLSKTKAKNKKDIIYTGRVAPIKNLEVAINSLALLDDKSSKLKIYGPCEKEYLEELKSLINKRGLKRRITIVDKQYDPIEQKLELDKSLVFVLPSISEGMPQVILEAMARGLIVIASNNPGNSDLIENANNGFLFINNNEEDLAKKLNQIFKLKAQERSKIQNNAMHFAANFEWGKIARKLEKVISS